MKINVLSLMALAASLRLATAAGGEDFVAHEWGTFTSVQGADGVQLQWNPLTRTDLPQFVYSPNNSPQGLGGSRLLDALGKGSQSSFIRMETPVIYFYSDKERTLDVRVNFPGGRITEWYPQATRVGPYQTTNKLEALHAAQSFIEWANVKVLAGNTSEISADKLIREKGENHYYSARETSANFLRMSSPHARSGTEHERHLFYRGVGFFQAPLILNLDASETHLELSARGAEPLTDLFVLTANGGRAHFQYVESLGKGKVQSVKLSSAPLKPLDQVQASISRDMKAALVRKGLFAPEAQAMVDTWKDQWFAEEGVRVLYLLPGPWTDTTLPLAIKPRPEKIVRVMVGRAELITPTMEWELHKQVALYSTGDERMQRDAVAATRKLGLGRFLEPATRKILGLRPSRAFSQAAWSLAQAASQEPDSKAPPLARAF